MAIKDVKIWTGRVDRKTGKPEVRVYVHTDDGREGTIYRTGNSWHKTDSRDGNLTDKEWNEAAEMAYSDGKWHTVSATQSGNGRASNYRCPDCGSPYCGPNCDSNRGLGWGR